MQAWVKGNLYSKIAVVSNR